MNILEKLKNTLVAEPSGEPQVPHAAIASLSIGGVPPLALASMDETFTGSLSPLMESGDAPLTTPGPFRVLAMRPAFLPTSVGGCAPEPQLPINRKLAGLNLENALVEPIEGRLAAG